LQPARLIYDITINILETNLRLAESFASFMRGIAVNLTSKGRDGCTKETCGTDRAAIYRRSENARD
jgi:hypothetical protein